jgi:hypothetical protein
MSAINRQTFWTNGFLAALLSLSSGSAESSSPGSDRVLIRFGRAGE